MNLDELIERAGVHHQAGEIDAARGFYERVLAISPDHPTALARSGLLELNAGRHQLALERFTKVAAQVRDNPALPFFVGECLSRLKRWREALAAYEKSIAMAPHSAEPLASLGIALQSLGDLEGARKTYEKALAISPDHADLLNNLGIVCQLEGDVQKAESYYRRTLAVKPEHAPALSNLGIILRDRGRLEEAAKYQEKAHELEPDAVGHAINLAATLQDLRRFAEAEQLTRRARQLDPHSADAAYNLASALAAQGRAGEAIEQYQATLALNPNKIDALLNLGNAFKELGRFAEAETAYKQVARLQPANSRPLNNLGVLYIVLNRSEQAEAVLRQALALKPNDASLLGNLGNALRAGGDLVGMLAAFRAAVAANPMDAEMHSNLAYSLTFAEITPEPVLQEAVRWNQTHAAPIFAQTMPLGPRQRRERLRIGYVAPDFRKHCQSLFTIPLLSNHDHEAFEIVCYSSTERTDEVTERIAGYADVFREVRMLSDAELAQLIRDDEVDILVDLTMHMAGSRLLTFARKPAPVQVSWLAYPGTTGVSAIDYRLSDPRLDPPGSDRFYTEKTVRLPDAFWCYDSLTSEPAVNELPALSNGFITFGCLNNPCKLTDLTLAIWASVLRRLPASRLMIMLPQGRHREERLQRLEALGVAKERIECVSFRPRAQYLASYQQIDLGLDTFPYNGHTTSLDSFWMGVPVVTRVGHTCVGRGGWSQLFQLNLTELAGETDEQFVEIAVALASDLPRLAQLRRDLRGRLQNSPLMDGPRFARNVEAAYRRMWSEFSAAFESTSGGAARPHADHAISPT
jgi:predicted O-linked N-acetylglucosamine transferase (SPINDLY family)